MYAQCNSTTEYKISTDMAGVEATTAAPEAGFVDTVITDTTYPIVAVIGCLGVINNTFAIVTTFTSSVMRKKVKVVPRSHTCQ
jgi:hypothetical protein